MGIKYSDNKNKPVIALNNGFQIPPIGIGTPIISLGGTKSVFADFILRKGKHTRNAFSLAKLLRSAPLNGCFMFDTARAYGKSEQILGTLLKKYPRDKIVIITKLANTDQRHGDIRKAFNTSLKMLGVKYVDLYLIHWPQTKTYINSWLQMEELYKEGLIKAIGVSNFHEHHLKKLMSVASVIPAVNEFERHPLLNQKPLVKYCNNIGVNVIAYTPIGRMHNKLKNNSTLIQLSKKYRKTIPQIILRWHCQDGVIPIPSTLKVSRLIEYMSIFDFILTENEMKRIYNINENLRLRHNPDSCDFTKL